MVGNPLGKGLQALREGRWENARSAFEGALTESESAEAHEGAGEALWWLGDVHASVEHRERAYALYRQDDLPRRAARTAVDLAITYSSNFGNGAAAGGWVARASSLIEGTDPESVHGWVWLMQAVFEPDPTRVQALILTARDLGRSLSDPDLELVALADLGLALVAAGSPDEGLPFIDQALAAAFAGEGTRLDTVVFAACDMLIACEMAEDLERASQWCRVAEDFARRHGSPFMYAKCRTIYGAMLLGAGDWGRAEEELVEAIRMAVGAGPAPHARAVGLLAELRLRQGRLEEAESLLASSPDENATALVSARLHLARGEAAVAGAVLRRAVEGSGIDSNTAESLETLVLAHLAGNDREAARAAATQLADAVSTAERGPIAGFAAAAAAHIARAEGLLEDAAAGFESALNRFSRHNLKYEAARARLNLAEVLVSNGQREIAAAEARRALDAFHHLGAESSAAEAASLLRTLGIKGPVGPKNVGLLTKREREVLRLVGAGLSNPEIARRLFITRKTAAHHVSAVLAKLGLRNRAEAAAYAIRFPEGPVDGTAAQGLPTKPRSSL